MATGRTVTKWIRIGVDDSGGTAREIPIDGISPVGFTYDETELTAWQDQVKGYLDGHPDATIDITGPWDNKIVAGFADGGAAPTLSGSHTVLYPIVGGNTPLAFAVHFGMQGLWADGDPVFGVITAGAANGYLCTKYSVEGSKYSARFVPYPGSAPAWGTTHIA
jgi:hypothetical protein